MIKIDFSGDPLDQKITLSGTDEILPVTEAKIQLAAGCIPTAQITLHPNAINLREVEGELFMFFKDRRFRLVDESKFDVVAKDGTHDSAFKEVIAWDVCPVCCSPAMHGHITCGATPCERKLEGLSKEQQRELARQKRAEMNGQSIAFKGGVDEILLNMTPKGPKDLEHG